MYSCTGPIVLPGHSKTNIQVVLSFASAIQARCLNPVFDHLQNFSRRNYHYKLSQTTPVTMLFSDYF